MPFQPSEPDVKSCGFLVFRDQPDFSFLLMKHVDRWDLPKGHVDEGETERQAASRELEEETAIRPPDIDIHPHFEFRHRYEVRKPRYGNRELEKELVVFLGLLKRPVELVLTEHIGFRWFRWDPPHQIQERTIDPLLKSVESFFARSGTHWPKRSASD